MGKNKNWFIESTVEAGEVVINDGGSSVDFRIEGDTDSNLLVTDGSADRVGIGTNTPSTKFHVTSDTIGELLSVSNHNVSATMPSEMILQKSRGSKVAPATLADSDEIGKITFKGYDGSNYDELAHIKVSSTSVSSDTSKMTFHSDKFVLDTGTLQFGSSGQAISSVSTAITAASADTELATAKSVHTAISAGVDASVVAGELVFNNVTTESNRYKVYFLSNHASNGTMAASDLKTDGTYFHFGGDADTNFKVKVTGATSITGATTITGATQVTGALTVGVNDTGHDVKLFGATSGKYMLWDENADTLQLGASGGSAGVDFIAYGATDTKYLHWDESANHLKVMAQTTLGATSGDTVNLKGTLKPPAYNESIIMQPFNNVATADVLIVRDKNSADALSVENDGKISINSDLSFVNPHITSLKIGDLSLGDSGGAQIINYDVNEEGGKTFIVRDGGVNRITLDASNNYTLHATTCTTQGTSEVKFRSAAVKINDNADSASAGVLEVSKVSTSSGGLTLDSASGTVTVDDHLTITGDISVTGANNFSGTTSDSFHLGTGGNNLGWKSISLADSADNTTVGLAINKWLHPVDSTGNTSTAGIIAKNIHTEGLSMTISTKQANGLLVLAPGYNHDNGIVSIGTSTSKQANLLCYGDADIRGDFNVNGTVTGNFAISGTSETTFQIDNGGSGPKLHVGSDDLIQTLNSDGATLEQIHTAGILLDSVKGASTNMSFKSYNGYMKMQPGTNANTARYLWLEGSIKIRSMGALTYNYIGGMNKIGAEAHGNFGTTDDLATGDTKIYMDNGELFFDASANVASFRTSDLVFGATDTNGSNSTDGNQVKFYGNETAAYMQWLQSSNKLILNGNGVGSEILNVKAGNAIFGVSGEDKCDVKFNGAAGEIIDIDSGESYAKFTQGIRKTPNVYSATQLLTKQMSGRPIVIRNRVGDSNYTLPAAANGLNFKFMIVERDGSFDVNIVTPSQTNFFFGSVLHIDTDNSQAVVSSNNTNHNKLNMQLLDPGSMIEVTCDGTNWYISGYAVSTETPAFSAV